MQGARQWQTCRVSQPKRLRVQASVGPSGHERSHQVGVLARRRKRYEVEHIGDTPIPSGLRVQTASRRQDVIIGEQRLLALSRGINELTNSVLLDRKSVV